MAPTLIVILAAAPAFSVQPPATLVVEGQVAAEQRELSVAELQRAIEETRRNIEDRGLTEQEQGELQALQLQLDYAAATHSPGRATAVRSSLPRACPRST